MATDLHCHDEYSTFDGYGSPMQRATLAKEMGYTSLSITNHGTTSGLIKHYDACKKVGIDCIMGIELYFIPILKDGVRESYHLCIFAKTLKGYQNMNRLATRGEEQKYYNPLVTFKDLEEFKEDIICTSACLGGYISQCIVKNNLKMAEKATKKFKEIFGDDFYIEIHPYKVEEKGLQERVNIELMRIAKKYDVKCILTSDAHYTRKEEYDTYLKMHEIGGSNYNIEATYKEHYMPTMVELRNRFVKMHKNKDDDKVMLDFNAMKVANNMMRNVEEIESKIEQNILDGLTLRLPVIKDADKKLRIEVQKGMKEHGVFKNKKYIERVKHELAVMKELEVSTYFLMVQDYVKYAKDNNIPVGHGRGSVCNCQVAREIGITEVDSYRFDLIFERFLRSGKKKLPDIDIDFATNRRQEVIDYLIDKYGESSAQISSYGLYKVDNLVNDLAKVCGLDNKVEIKELKDLLESFVEKDFVYDETHDKIDYFNKEYDNICLHFSRMYKKIRYMGTHAAGVAICEGNIQDYCALTIKKNKDGTIRKYTAYDLSDLDEIHLTKFDMLGLKTMEELGELRKATGNKTVTEEMYTDKKIWDKFRKGDTEGIFQLDKRTPRDILKKINADNFEDAIATNSLNRPAPLNAKMPDLYAHNKKNKDEASKNKWYEYTKETHGVIVYQEQVQKLVIQIGDFTFDEADTMLKMIKNMESTSGDTEEKDRIKKELLNKFVKNAQKKGWTKEEAEKTFKALMSYLFNKGHATGYSMISLEEMYYLVYYPVEFWCSKINNTDKDQQVYKYKKIAVKNDIFIMFPSVNATARNSVEIFEGEKIIREGYGYVKDVGAKASKYIEDEKNRGGEYKNKEDFLLRCKKKGSPVNKKVIEALEGCGALVFDDKVREKRSIKYLTSLLS